MILRPDQSVALLRTITEKQQEQSIIVPLADTGIKEVQTIVCPAVAAAAQADYFIFSNKAGDVYAAWLDIDANGTAPTGAAYVASDYQIKCSVVTGDTAAQVATKVKAAIEGDLNFAGIVITRDTATLSFTQTLVGDVTAPARHNANDSGNGSFTVSTLTAGFASNLNSKYFLINSPSTSYYVWFNINSEGVDPAPGGTGIEVAIAAGSSIVDAGSAISTAIDNSAAFVCRYDTVTGLIYSTNSSYGEATNATTGNSGFTVVVGNQGVSDLYTPYMNVSTIQNEPSLITALS